MKAAYSAKIQKHLSADSLSDAFHSILISIQHSAP